MRESSFGLVPGMSQLGKQTAVPFLLRAVFTQGESAIEAWHVWKSLVDLSGHVDRESVRLFPQLADNLTAVGIDDPLIAKFNGVRRFTWYKNKMLIERVLPAMGRLSSAGIRVILVGEAAMLLVSGAEYGLYPIDAFNILVDPHDSERTLDLLNEHGWRPVSEAGRPVDNLREHTIVMDRAGNSMRINWRLLPEYGGQRFDKDVWEGAQTISVRGAQITVQNTADQLLSICSHGMRAQTVSFYARAGEAQTLLNAFAGGINWDRLLAQAQKRRLQQPVSSVLSYIHDELGTAIPQPVWEQLSRQPLSAYERVERRVLDNNVPPFNEMSRLWFRYLRLAGDPPPYQSLKEFPRYLQQRWQLPHVWHVPGHALKLTLSTLRGRAR